MTPRTVKQQLIRLDLPLDDVPGPFGTYVPAKRVGDLLHVAGQLPMAGGKLLHSGRVGADVSVGDAQECARRCVLNAFAAAETVAGGVNQLSGVAQVRVYVACGGDFAEQSQVANAASTLLHDVFGDAGRHVRAAVGVASLPLGAPVEVEVTFTCTPEDAKDHHALDAETARRNPHPPSLGPDKSEKIGETL